MAGDSEALHGSLGVPLGSVVTALANTTAAMFGQVCPRPVLLSIRREALPDDMPALDPNQPAAEIQRQGMERIHTLVRGGQAESSTLFFLGDSSAVVGRGMDQCDVVLSARSVSRRHAVLRESDLGWMILDFESTAGTFVEGKQVESGTSEILVAGQRIKFGGQEALFLSPLQLRNLSIELAGTERDLAAAEPAADDGHGTSVDLASTGMRLKELVPIVAGDPDYLATFTMPVLLETPTEDKPLDSPETGRFASATMHDDDGIDPSLDGSTVRISAEELQSLEPSKKVKDAWIHVLVPRGEGAEIAIGRGKRCDVVLPEGTVSSTHASIYQGRDGTWRIVDTESQNGTYVNGGLLPSGLRMPLRGGEQVWFARYRARFMSPEQFQKTIGPWAMAWSRKQKGEG